MSQTEQGPYRSVAWSAPAAPRSRRRVWPWVGVMLAAGVIESRSRHRVGEIVAAQQISALLAPAPGFEPLGGVTAFLDDRSCALTRTRGTYCWGRAPESRTPGGHETFNVGVPGDRIEAFERMLRAVAGPPDWDRWQALDPSRRQIVQRRGWCVLTRRGAVWCAESEGETRRPITEVRGLPEAVDLAYNENERCVATTAGAVACWSALDRTVLTITQLPRTVTRVAMSDGALCALDQEHRVTCGDLDHDGRLSYGAITHGRAVLNRFATMRDVRERVELRGARAITSAGRGLCVITAREEVECWGTDAEDLARGTPSESLRPYAVEGLSGVVSVALGDAHACALLRNGRVRCWGGNEFGERGDEVSRFARGVQAPIDGLYDVVQIEARAHTTCARTRRGAVWCWGSDESRVLPEVSFGRHPRPERVALPVAAEALVMHHGGACVRTAQGAVWCWGASGAPHEVVGIAAVQQIVSAGEFVCARGHGVWCWRAEGRARVPVDLEGSSALSTGFNEDRLCGVWPEGVVRCVSVAETELVASSHGLMEAVRAWESPLRGVTAVTTSEVTRPDYGVDREGVLLAAFDSPEHGLRGVREVRVSHGFACAVHTDGTVSCWGENRSGRLGRAASLPEVAAPVVVFSQVQQ